jgi:hypothetical protein
MVTRLRGTSCCISCNSGLLPRLRAPSLFLFKCQTANRSSSPGLPPSLFELLRRGRPPPSLRGALATKQSIARQAERWIASRSLSSGAHSRDPLARNDVEAYVSDLAAWFARGLQIRCPSFEIEGAGNAGCALHPRSHVPKCARMAAHEHTGQRRTHRHPLRNGFTAYFVLFPVERACCHRRP